jgi:hypothetical protein
MDDGDSKSNNKQIQRKAKSINATKRYGINDSSILQSIWIRCRSIFPNTTDRKFMESELRFVLYSGVIFWIIYLLYETIK